MMIVGSKIQLWENARMSLHHRQVSIYAVFDVLRGGSRGQCGSMSSAEPGENVNVQRSTRCARVVGTSFAF
jgi:hypothetical protein